MPTVDFNQRFVLSERPSRNCETPCLTGHGEHGALRLADRRHTCGRLEKLPAQGRSSSDATHRSGRSLVSETTLRGSVSNRLLTSMQAKLPAPARMGTPAGRSRNAWAAIRPSCCRRDRWRGRGRSPFGWAWRDERTRTFIAPDRDAQCPQIRRSAPSGELVSANYLVIGRAVPGFLTRRFHPSAQRSSLGRTDRASIRVAHSRVSVSWASQERHSCRTLGSPLLDLHSEPILFG